ncbi:MAG TPA: UDP-N-acetylmuramoyl-tripeptide--D-alanyl-D-alanine ligase [Candidatus Limnocylindrales bacterium]|nr:UDP-N-acetylmuramoyl-tripeptide--D-alanyl-D-alanine ligase [Candidatus Limnocylindrales bacterium]
MSAASADSAISRPDGRDLAHPATVGDAALAIGALVRSGGDPAAVYERVSTDSRTIASGDLFFCLRGPTFDAHDFIADAVRAGAAGIVCEHGRGGAVPAASATAVIETGDTLAALGELAAWHRRGSSGPVIGVTGSNGKTTTKEMLRAILVAHHGADRVLATRGNLNNLIGVPLTIFQITTTHTAAVIEMGMNVPGEIARLTEISRPTVGVITCVAEAHLEGLGTIEGVARAKGELFEGLDAAAVAVVNCDDPNIVRESSRFAGRHLTFGSRGDVRAEDVRCDRISASTFDIAYAGERARVELPLGGRHNVQNALAAAAASIASGVPLATAAHGLSKMTPPPMRMSAEALPNGVTLVNDAYNANPGSLGAALATLGGLDARRIVVIGDMLELGPRSAELHRRVGAQAAGIEPALLCAYGKFAADVAGGATGSGLDASRVLVCASHAQAADAVASVWLPGDAVLVKGSRGSAMEHVVERLRATASGSASR